MRFKHTGDMIHLSHAAPAQPLPVRHCHYPQSSASFAPSYLTQGLFYGLPVTVMNNSCYTNATVIYALAHKW